MFPFLWGFPYDDWWFTCKLGSWQLTNPGTCSFQTSLFSQFIGSRNYLPEFTVWVENSPDIRKKIQRFAVWTKTCVLKSLKTQNLMQVQEYYLGIVLFECFGKFSYILFLLPQCFQSLCRVYLCKIRKWKDFW